METVLAQTKNNSETYDLEKKLSFDLADLAMILFFTQRLVTFVLTEIFGNYGILLFMAALAVLYLVASIQKYRQGNKLAIIAFILVILFFAINIFISLLRHPELDFWLFGSEWNVVLQWVDPRKSLAGVLVILLVKDKSKILRNLHIVGVAMFWYLILQIILFEYAGHWGFYYSSGDEGGIYNMSLGYEFVFATIILITTGLRKKVIKYSIMASFAAALTIYYGSRGSIIVLLVYLALTFIFTPQVFDDFPGKGSSRKKAAFFMLGYVAVIGLIVFLLIPLLRMLTQSIYTLTADSAFAQNILEGVDLDDRSPSRNIDAITSGEFFKDNGRFRIWELSFQAFKENPLFGQGFFSDRLYIGHEFNWGYSHNILFELISHFGLFGLAFLGFILLWTVRTLMKQDNQQEKLLIILFGSMCMKLLISDSYAFYSYFWAYMGLIVLNLTVGRRFKAKPVISTLIVGSAATAVLAISFITVDYRNYSYSTIEIEKPSILLTTTGFDDSIYFVHNNLNENGYTATAFLNPGNFLEETSIFGYFDTVMPTLVDDGWEFADGNYYYQNPYIRTPELQENNRQAMNAYLAEYGQEEPVAFNVPYNSSNSTVQFRSKSNYTFIQQQFNARTSSPYKRISYPETLELRAVDFAWSEEEEQVELINYLERAEANDALAIVNFDLANIEREDLEEFILILNEMDFQQISYADLAAETTNDANLDFANYIENTYLYQLLASFI